MPVYKDDNNGTFYVQCYYRDARGSKRHKTKRGFSTEVEAAVLQPRRALLRPHRQPGAQGRRDWLEEGRRDMAFRCTPEEHKLICEMAAWSGMNRQDYIIAKLTDT